MKSAPQRSLRDSKLLRDVHAGEILELASHENFSELVRESLDGSFQPQEELPAFCFVVGSIAARDFGSSILARVAEGATLSDPPTHVVPNHIDRNAEKPSLELCAAVEALGAPRNLEEGHLNEVVQVGAPGAREPRDESIDRHVVAIEELAQRSGVASAERGEKLRVRSTIGNVLGGEGHDGVDQNTTRAPIDAQGMRSLSPVDSTSRWRFAEAQILHASEALIWALSPTTPFHPASPTYRPY